MISRSLATRTSRQICDAGDLTRLLAEGGDERLMFDPQTGRNAYGCSGEMWTGGWTFSCSTASPLWPETFAVAQAWLSSLPQAVRPGDLFEIAAAEIRRTLMTLCSLAANGRSEADVILAPSGTDLHHIAAVCARSEARGSLVTIMPNPAESGRGVERALRGLPYAARPPFGSSASGESTVPAGDVIPIAIRTATGAERGAEEIDLDVEAACRRAAQQGGAMLLVVLDVSKTGLSAPTTACAAHLKACYGERLTVLVDACQFRQLPADIREHLRHDFLVAITGSKYLGGPPFSGALLIPNRSAERLRLAALSSYALECSAREEWPVAYAGRTLLPHAFSVGPSLRWSPALDTLAALESAPVGVIAALAEGFGAEFAGRVEQGAETFSLLTSRAGGPARPGCATIFPLILKRNGRVLGADAVSSIYMRLRDLAHARNAGQFWLGQPVTIGHGEDGPISAMRFALSAPQLLAYARDPHGCSRLMALADECLWEMRRMTEDD
jgi:hypothetical protein